MVYTCAYFPQPDATLEDAQTAKMDLVCRKLWLRPGERVVEAGCGWGALALFMARRYGVRVRAFNVSTEQIAYARERARREGLAGQVEFVEDDYRNVRGEFDAFVSVGMLEHVGLPDYPTLGGVIERSLTGAGARAAALHRPQSAGAAQSVDPEADLSRRVSAVASRSVRARPRAAGILGPRRREPPAALREDARALAAPLRSRGAARSPTCSTRRSCARGGCIWPARRRRSRPARCSSFRSCSRAAGATPCRGRGTELRMSN